MSTPQQLSEQVLALPSGPGGIHGLGETFGADPYTGTGRLRLALPLPAGHGGLRPELALIYSSGAGNGVCGVGWSFSAGNVRRRTEKGIPRYRNDDLFVLGDDELVPFGDDRFVLRSEGSFSRIRHVRTPEDFWAVTERPGLRKLYGRRSADRDGDANRITAWHLSEVRDADDNRVTYGYARDRNGRRAYLTSAEWGAGVYRLVLEYETRPDVIRTARAGFAQYTDRRLVRIRVQVRRTSTGAFSEFDRFELGYDTSQLTGLSRLRTVSRTSTHSGGGTRAWPTLQLGYTEPAIGGDVVDITSRPGGTLKASEMSLVDLDGDGLVDVLQSTSFGWQVWRNDGADGFSPPVPIEGPAGTRLKQVGVFLSDMAGDGFADLVTPAGYWPNEGSGFGRIRRFGTRPSFDLEDVNTRFMDLDGDGVGDVLVQTGTGLACFINTPGEGFSTAPLVRHHPEGGLPRLSDDWTRIADIDGDGLSDIVRLSRGGIEVWQNLGDGNFSEMRRIALPEALPADVEPEHLHLLDLTGTGAADLVVLRPYEIWIFPNGCGASLGSRRTLRCRPVYADWSLEAVDLRGTGVSGLLLTDQAGWTWYEICEGRRPDTLATVNNGMGATTTVTYGSSTLHSIRDRRANQRWTWPLPYAVPVVDQVTTEDSVTGVRVTRRYRYHDGYHDGVEREFRGFARVEELDTETDAGTSTAIPSRVVRYYDVGRGERPVRYFAPVPTSLPVDTVPNYAGAKRALRGLLVREEVYGEDGTSLAALPYLVTHNGFTVTRVAGPPPGGDAAYFAASTHTLVAHTERSADPRVVETFRTFDRYGRLTQERERATGRRGSFSTAHETQQTATLERLTRFQYLTRDQAEPSSYDGAYTPAYLVDRVSQEERYKVESGVETRLYRERFYYDGTAYQGLGYPGSGTSASVERGRLSCKLVLAYTSSQWSAAYDSTWGAASARSARGNYLTDGGDYYVHAERYQYGSYGMRTGVRDPNGNTATIQYDATHGLFVTQFTDAAGHPTTLTRGDFAFQVTDVGDANGNTTTYSWDASGLPASKSVKGKFVSGAWQGDPTTHPTEQYEYDFSTVPVRVIVRRRQTRLGSTFDMYRYLDGVGRVVQERHTSEPDPSSGATRYRVTGWQTFNEKGQVVRAYQPTFASSSTYATGSTSTAYVSTTYDPVGRPNRVDQPDGTYETTTYHPWVREAADRNDNGSGISSSDPRYGTLLSAFSSHFGTKTRVYLDGLGREIAVAEDNGGGTSHVTRSEYDLRDQLLRVYDARGLSGATWTFAYDGAGRRIQATHSTALGARYALSDAAGNPIWARDAKSVEVNRTFDALSRPLTESTDESGTVKLRRAWAYIAYNPSHVDFTTYQAKNLFGQAEEERDADGLRYFEYDWRGLVTTASHRFWPQTDGSGNAWNVTTSAFWTSGAAWDPGVDSTARTSITSWLVLTNLTDTTTISLTTSYDAAGRPIEQTFPEGMKLRRSYNAAGNLYTLEVDRGSGYSTVVSSYLYNARGQCTGYTHGNGVITERSWDPDIERLTRIYTYLPGSPKVEFQDLEYDYDPVGNPLQITDNLTTSSYKANQIIPNTRTFRYDPRYRLTRATGKKHASIVARYDEPLVSSPDPNDYDPYDYTYSYDAVGNLTQNDEYGGGTLQYKANRVDLFNGDSTEATSTDPTLGNYRYDANGNTTYTPRFAELAYTFDNQPRYVDKGGGTQIRYMRHADQRVVRFVKKNGVRALGIYLGPFEYQYREGTTAYTKVVLHVEGQGRHAQAEKVLSGSDPDSLTLFHFHGDHLGSGHLLTKTDGTLLSQEEFFPYGLASDRRDARNRYRFIGVERDEDTGLAMTGPRTYEPGIGRFLQADSLIGKAQSPFAYSSGSPLSRKDPNGYQDATATGEELEVELTRSDASPAPPSTPPPTTTAEPAAKYITVDGRLARELPELTVGADIGKWAERKVREQSDTRFFREDRWILSDVFKCNVFVAEAYREGGKLPFPRVGDRDPVVSELADPEFMPGMLEWHKGDADFMPRPGDIAVWYNEETDTHHAAIVTEAWMDTKPDGDPRLGMKVAYPKFKAAYAGTAAPDPNLKIASSDYLNSKLQAEVVFRRWREAPK